MMEDHRCREQHEAPFRGTFCWCSLCATHMDLVQSWFSGSKNTTPDNRVLNDKPVSDAVALAEAHRVKEAELTRRELACTDKAAELARREAEAQAILAQRDKDLIQREEACCREEASLRQQQQQQQEQEAAHQAREAAQLKESARLKQESAGLKHELERQQQESAQLQQRRRELAAEASQLEAQKSAQLARQLELEQEAARLATQKAEDAARLELWERQLECRAGELRQRETELHERAQEVQARHDEMERVRLAAMQDACAYQVGLVLNNGLKTSLSTAQEGVAQFCDVSSEQVVAAAPDGKYPLVILFSPGGNRLVEMDGINPGAIQAHRKKLAPGGKLVLALLRPGQLNTSSGSGLLAINELRDDGLEIDVLVDLCTDRYLPERPLHPPTASKMNEDGFGTLTKHMPPPPPPPPDPRPLFAWAVAT